MNLTHYLNRIEQISEWTGRAVSWLAFALVLLVSADVLMRYVFDISKSWYLELEWHVFALLFMVSLAYTLKHKSHVRVDVFYAGFSDKYKAVVDVIGHILLLIPWCILIVYASYHYGYNSFLIDESSADPGGLPYRYLIKFSITFSFVLLFIQGSVELIKSIQILIGVK